MLNYYENVFLNTIRLNYFNNKLIISLLSYIYSLQVIKRFYLVFQMNSCHL